MLNLHAHMQSYSSQSSSRGRAVLPVFNRTAGLRILTKRTRHSSSEGGCVPRSLCSIVPDERDTVTGLASLLCACNRKSGKAGSICFVDFRHVLAAKAHSTGLEVARTRLERVQVDEIYHLKADIVLVSNGRGHTVALSTKMGVLVDTDPRHPWPLDLGIARRGISEGLQMHLRKLGSQRVNVMCIWAHQRPTRTKISRMWRW
jgi:hypothetical protein